LIWRSGQNASHQVFSESDKDTPAICVLRLNTAPGIILAQSPVEIVAFLVIWIILSVVAGAITGNKGNSFIAAFLISLLLSPIIGIVFALAQRPNAGHR
jgi:hypothetical protein